MKAAVFTAQLLINKINKKEKGDVYSRLSTSSVLWRLAAACDRQPWPVRMLQTLPEEEEVEVVEGGYIYLSLLHRSEGWSTASPSDPKTGGPLGLIRCPKELKSILPLWSDLLLVVLCPRRCLSPACTE